MRSFRPAVLMALRIVLFSDSMVMEPVNLTTLNPFQAETGGQFPGFL